MPELHFSRHSHQSKLTHYLLRFPAKFHAPAVRCLIERFSEPGDVLLDPFCGSGTLLVEAVVAGRSAIGTDVDPLAVFISKVKTTPISPRRLERAFSQIQTALRPVRRSDAAYDRLVRDDFDESAVTRLQTRLEIPPIPNIHHWFRSYVVIDLAQLRRAINSTVSEPQIRRFFLGCFASIIRNASNADPVPVSGLEVTAHMRKLEAAGRRIDPFALFDARVRREMTGMKELWERTQVADVRVLTVDASADLARRLTPNSADVVITSPPYNTAVDYYRRHTLEMYWLGLVRSHEERLTLAPKYLGRTLVHVSNPRLRTDFASPYVTRLISHARRIAPSRERAVTHYCASMSRSLEQIARTLKPGGKAVFVVGNAKWNGRRVRATKLLKELAAEHFCVLDTYWYAARNRYMSYSRHNGADVNREYVLVLQRKT